MTRVYGFLIALGLFAAYSVAIYMWGSANAADTARLQQLQAENDRLLQDLEREQKARAADARQALEDRKDLDQFQISAEELRNDLKDPDGIVFDSHDADGLRSLEGSQYKAKSPGTAK